MKNMGAAPQKRLDGFIIAKRIELVK